MIITFRIGWRRSYDSSTFCDQSVINSGQLIGINDYLSCSRRCYGDVGLLRFRCTDFSINEDWTIGTNSFQYTFPIPVMSPRYYQVRLVVNPLTKQQVAVLGNFVPSPFQYRPSAASSEKKKSRANIPQYGSSKLLTRNVQKTHAMRDTIA